jgi:hypothetical protein
MKLCPNSILLENGNFKLKDTTENVIKKYIRKEYSKENVKQNEAIIVDNLLIINNLSIQDNNLNYVCVDQGMEWDVTFEAINLHKRDLVILFNFELKTGDGINIGCFGNQFQHHKILLSSESSRIKFSMGAMALKAGEYFMNVFAQVVEFNSSVYEVDYLTIKVDNCININKKWNTYINQSQHGHTPILWENVSIE